VDVAQVKQRADDWAILMSPVKGLAGKRSNWIAFFQRRLKTRLTGWAYSKEKLQ